ncbi:MAG: heparinase II/III family protein, partial [Candidatus Cryptobacteroides sp.]|nr:heparinase II/III family protein [Candidatus Cryptobacteroides sp.]
RILAGKKEFAAMKKAVNSGRNPYLVRMHEDYIEMADECVESNQTITYSPNGSGKLLLVSRETTRQLMCCAYAWRFTGARKYLVRAESVLKDVCAFETWHPEHYLDVSEMAIAVAIAYDWLYSALGENTRKACEYALTHYSMDTAEREDLVRLFHKENNWGQVLNAGLIASCIAIYETDPQRCRSLIRRSVECNAENIDFGYAPDGVYPEGAMYWGYGTSYQILLLDMLSHCYGTDFGISNCKGFRESAYYEIFANGNIKMIYNYSDSGPLIKPHNELWWFAHRFNDPSLLYSELQYWDRHSKEKFNNKLGAMHILNASKVKVKNVQKPSQNIFYGNGINPIVIARTGWSKEDLYLGMKGGKASNPHGHMDAGSFVFEAFGVRWIREPSFSSYETNEKALASIGKTLWALRQDSYRWKLWGYGCREHSCYVVNDKDHCVTGTATIKQVHESPERMGGTLSMTDVFGGDLQEAERTICIVDKSYLEIRDIIVAPSDREAKIRWTVNASVTPQLGQDGIILKSGSRTMLLKAEGAEITYGIWSSDPKDYDNPAAFFQKPSKNDHPCGFTFTVPAGAKVELTTTLKAI